MLFLVVRECNEKFVELSDLCEVIYFLRTEGILITKIKKVKVYRNQLMA
jgi:hypothetical protein